MYGTKSALHSQLNLVALDMKPHDPTVSGGRPVWRSAFNPVLVAQAAVVATVITLLYGRILADLVVDWWTIPSYSHGIVILPLSLLIISWNRRSLLAIPVSPDNRGLLITAFACVLYAAGQLGAEFFLQRSSFAVLLSGLIVTFWGTRRAAKLALPLLLFASTIPLPAILYNLLAAPLQVLASRVATEVAQEFGVAAYRDGNIISLSQITLGVAEACSGLNSLSALMVGSVLLGFLNFQRPLPRWILFLAAIPLSIMVNVIRVAGTAILADYNPALALGLFHSFSGWLVFTAGFASLYFLSMLLQRVMRAPTY